MTRLLASIAVRHLLARRRQSIVSLTGIVLGVAFFLAVSSLMHGSEEDFIHRLIDNAPHATVTDEYRAPRRQPLIQLYPDGAVEIRHVKPLTETRGIRHYDQIVATARQEPGVMASAVLVGQGILTFAGRNTAVTLNGVTPSELDVVSNLHNYMKQGKISDLAVNRSGIIIGSELARTMSIAEGENVTLASPTGQVAVFKVVGIFSTGRTDYDQRQAFADIRRVQALMNRPDRANSVIVKLPDPYGARDFAARLEARAGYKVVSWQELWKDLMDTLHIRNIIMYSVVSAILVVASFGIYNVISTVVMEKHRDIAILKSMGFLSRDIRQIFLVQGVILGAAGSVMGLGFGTLLMSALMRVKLKPPGSTEPITMPLSWAPSQFAIAAAFAVLAAVFASYLPARKGAGVRPVDIPAGGGMTDTPVLQAVGVTRRLEEEAIPVTLVNGISLDVRRGEFMAIMGPSGSGKSSLLYLLGLLDKPTSGHIMLDGADTSGMGEEELAALRLEKIGFVFQFHYLLPEFTAVENVAIPMRRLGRLSAREIDVRARGLLDSFGLKDHMDKTPSQMSGGQRQRVAVARALANDPLILLADEPTGNLDTASSENVRSILRALADGKSKTVIAVTHDEHFASAADRIVTLVDGRIVNPAAVAA